jgi:M6 family metalloprotease-like protein
MMSNRSSSFIVAIFLGAVATNLFAQSNDWICGINGSYSSSAMMVNTPFKIPILPPSINRVQPNPTGKNFKVAALYFKLDDDTFNSGDCKTTGWLISSPSPSWMGQLLISTPFNSATVQSDTAAKPNSLTTYWYRMSNGNLWLYGDEHIYTGPPIIRSTEENLKSWWRVHNRDILQWYVNNYDLGTLDKDGDMLVDMIMLICRARPKFGYGTDSTGAIFGRYQGVADGDYLPSPITISDAAHPTEPDIRGEISLINNSGVYGTDCYNLEDARRLMAHELGHQIWNSGHRNGIHRWNLMSGAGTNPPTHSGSVASAFEKSLLGWLTPAIITNDATGVELSDLTSSNQAIRIPVNNAGATNDYFLCEYRRNNLHYEFIQPICTEPGLGQGLLISYMRSGEVHTPFIRPADNVVTVIGGKRDGDDSDLFPNGGITKITPYTTPNTADWNGSRTGLAILNIQYSGAGNSKVKFDIHQNYWEGVISTNTTWSGNVFVGGDVTVAGGVTLTVQSGAVITFAANSDNQAGGLSSTRCEIIVNGTLNATGATLTAATKGAWWGIRYMSSSSGGSLTNCTIRNAYNAVTIDNVSPSISSCFIDDADLDGIVIIGSLAWPNITQNYIEADQACVNHGGGNGNFWQNSFRNAKWGVYVGSGSPRYDYYNFGRNKFETSIFQDKARVNSGQPWLGMYQYFTIPNGSYKYIRNLGTSTINAVQNYWSAYPPSSTYFYGSVDRSNPLSSPPSNPPAGPGWSLPKGAGDDFFLAFNDASRLFFDKKYAEARESFKELTENYLDSEYSSYSLNWYMLSTEQLEAVGTQRGYLNSIKQDNSAHANTRFYAQKWHLQCELREGTREKAKNRAAEVERGSGYDREISFDLAMGLYYYQGDKQGAEEILAELSEKFKDEDTAEAVEIIKSLMNIESAASKPMAKRPDEADEGFSLGVFPNPSNASIKISYALENSGPVSLAIYNVLGQKVLTLVDGDLEAGRHEASWDGKDRSAKAVASGVYLCRLETMGHIKTVKLLLAK